MNLQFLFSRFIEKGLKNCLLCTRNPLLRGHAIYMQFIHTFFFHFNIFQVADMYATSRYDNIFILNNMSSVHVYEQPPYMFELNPSFFSQ
jgi:hypothetical protein